MKTTYYYFIIVIILLVVSCKGNPKPQQQATPDNTSIMIPQFNADSAYSYIDRQVAFGYRIPGTESHRQTAQWLADELIRHKANVITQQAIVTAYDGTRLPIYNIIGQYAPEKNKRILLLAHWDSRPYADNDPDPQYHHTPIDGANDGASGVGVLLEIARQLSMHQPNVGIDILLVDAEDYGAPYWYNGNDADTWALGSQYWATHPHKPGYKAQYGILLDMVGSRGDTFYREQLSEYYARPINNKIWQCAQRLGYEHLFVDEIGGAVTDDHLYINKAGIPTIDIIQHNPNSDTGFVEQWHTRNDNMSYIDNEVLKAVGQTVITVIFEEK